jgi:hypothetical protein
VATIPATRSGVDRGLRLITWANLGHDGATGDDGDPVDFADFADRTVAVTGTFGSGGTVVIEGSLDGEAYFPLTDPQGNNISITSEKLELISEMTYYVRPRVTAGDGDTDLTVKLLVRKG